MSLDMIWELPYGYVFESGMSMMQTCNFNVDKEELVDWCDISTQAVQGDRPVKEVVEFYTFDFYKRIQKEVITVDGIKKLKEPLTKEEKAVLLPF